MSASTVTLLERADSIEFWRELCPAMTVSEQGGVMAAPEVTVPKEALEQQLVRLKQDGYFHVEAIFLQKDMTRLADAVSRVADTVEHAVFALVYDDLWWLLARLAPVLSAVLGDDYKALPDSWVWRLLPGPEDSGWKPHRDRAPGTVLPDGTPQSLSVWIPLTDATPLNGCIYVLPASLDVRYHTYGDKNKDTVVQWQDIRALPAQAGSVLGWTSQLLHWGGRSSRWAAQPRISLAFELQSSALPPRSAFLLNPHEVPTFSMRLALIARQLLQYQHMVSLPPDLARWCRQQIKQLPRRRSFASVLQKLVKGHSKS